MYTKGGVLLLAALALTACGSSKGATTSNALLGPSTAPTAGAVDGPGAAAAAAGASASAAAGASSSGAAGCALSSGQVSGVMGATYADPTSSYGICSYLGPSDAVSIAVTTGSGDAAWATALATVESDQGSPTTTVIAGVGDKAVGVGKEVLVASGSHLIDVRNADAAAPWPKASSLAKLVIAELH